MSLFNLYGPVNQLGYGQFTLGIMGGLAESGLRMFHTCPIGQVQLEEVTKYNEILRQTTMIPWNRGAPSVAIWHEFDLSKFSGRKLIAFPIFETTGFTPAAIQNLRQMDAVCVASNWAKEIVRTAVADKIPVFVVPGGAEILQTPAVLETKKSNCFTFLFVGKYEQRKSPLEMIQAYISAFSNNNSAETRFMLHCFNPFDRQFAQSMVSGLQRLGLTICHTTSTNSIVATKGNAIVEVPVGRVSREQVFQLYRYCHVGVFPSKGEGWNLPLMEAIQSGMPCIASNYSAHTEYLRPDFGYPPGLLLNRFSMQPAVDGVYFKGDRGNWAVPSIEELAAKMQYAYDNYEELSKFDNGVIKEKFNWKTTASKLFDVIKQM